MNRPSSSLLAVPAWAVRAIRGKKLARAAPMLALAASSCCSDWRMSGRLASSSEGRPAGSSASWGASASRRRTVSARRSSGSGWPSSSTRAFSSRARWRSCCARVARAVSVSDSAWRKSSSEATPLSSRSLVRRIDSSRVATVRRDRSISSSSASSASQPLATAETRLICAALRPSSLARYKASACSFRLESRPKKSISQALTAKPTLKELVRLPLIGLGARCAVDDRLTVGNRLARWIWYCARTCSTLSIASRRSRLLSSDRPISRRSRSSAK